MAVIVSYILHCTTSPQYPAPYHARVPNPPAPRRGAGVNSNPSTVGIRTEQPPAKVRPESSGATRCRESAIEARMPNWRCAARRPNLSSRGCRFEFREQVGFTPAPLPARGHRPDSPSAQPDLPIEREEYPDSQSYERKPAPSQPFAPHQTSADHSPDLRR